MYISSVRSIIDTTRTGKDGCSSAYSNNNYTHMIRRRLWCPVGRAWLYRDSVARRDCRTIWKRTVVSVFSGSSRSFAPFSKITCPWRWFARRRVGCVRPVCARGSRTPETNRCAKSNAGNARALVKHNNTYLHRPCTILFRPPYCNINIIIFIITIVVTASARLGG